jgi:hypothetical protein
MFAVMGWPSLLADVADLALKRYGIEALNWQGQHQLDAPLERNGDVHSG